MTIPSVSFANAARPAPRPASSSARTERSALRPIRANCSREIGAFGAGPRSPLICSSTAGSPARLTSPCSETVSGSARRDHCALARDPPGSVPVSCRAAASTVRFERDRRVVAAVRPRHDPRLVPLARREVAEHEHAVDQGGVLRARPGARSRGAAAPARGRDQDQRLAQVAPDEPRPVVGALLGLRLGAGVARAEDAPELEQRRGAGQLGEARAVGRVAVGEDDDPPVRQPRADADHRLEVALAVDGPPARRAAVDVEPRAAQRRGDAVGQRVVAARSPGCARGTRCRAAAASPASRSLPYARLGSNASATARVRTGVGRPWSEKATTKMASRAGMKAAR